MSGLSQNEKHRVIHKFLPALRGHWLEGDDMDDFYTDAVRRARNRGWSDAEIERCAKAGKWSKPRSMLS